MERRDSASVTTLFAPDLANAREVTLSEEATHHLRVKRLEAGAPLVLVDGAGLRATATLVRTGKRDAIAEVVETDTVPMQPAVHLLAPIADKERMLWLAEKATELGAASWRPVLFRRSKSVSPRGEGMTFQGKVRARMISALEQSGGAWLPDLFPDARVDGAIAAAPAGTRLLLDASGDSALSLDDVRAPISVVVGPEGGIERDERDLFVAAGFRPVSIGANVMRFETAGVAGLAVARALLGARSPEPATSHG